MHTEEKPGNDGSQDRGDACTSQGAPECQPTTRIWEKDLEQILPHRLHEETTPQTPSSLTSSPWNYEIRRFYCLSHQVCLRHCVMAAPAH